MNLRVFHFSEGASHKFWSIALDGATQTVQFGRIGTAGQTQTKTFDSDTEAHKATEKLIEAKRKKGYTEVAPEAACRVPPKKREPRRAYYQMSLPF